MVVSLPLQLPFAMAKKAGQFAMRVAKASSKRVVVAAASSSSSSSSTPKFLRLPALKMKLPKGITPKSCKA